MAVARGKVYWIDACAKTVRHANIDGSDVGDLVTGLEVPLGLAVDARASKIYWIEQGEGRIRRANADGSELEDVASELVAPAGSALALGAGRVYWADRKLRQIVCCGLDGSDVRPAVSDLKNPNAVAVDMLAGKLYWGDFGTRKIHRASLDGSQVEDVVVYGKNSNGIVIDAKRGKLFWANFGIGAILTCDLDGSGMRPIVTGLQRPNAIALASKAGKVYWVDRDTKKIQRANLDGSAVEDVVTNLGDPWGVALGPEEELPAAPSACVEAIPEEASKEQREGPAPELPALRREAGLVDDAGEALPANAVPCAVPALGAATQPPSEDTNLVMIEKYQWGDEDKAVKIYINEGANATNAAAVAAAKDGRGSLVVTDFGTRSFAVTVNGEEKRYMLRLRGLFGEVEPGKCKVRVSAGKRITVTLAKLEEAPWRVLSEKTW